MRLTERDFRLLNWIAEQLVVNKLEVTDLLALDAQKQGRTRLGRYATREIVHKWTRYGLVQSFYKLQRGSHIYLTRKGMQACAAPFTARTPGQADFAHLTHHDDVNRLRLYLEEQAWQTGQPLLWHCERRLMQQEKVQGGEYGFEQRAHRPDAVVIEQELAIAIEVERTYKRPRHLKTILTDYVYSPRYAQVRYYCTSKNVAQNVQRVLKSLLADTPLIQQTELSQKIWIQHHPLYD